jgi:flagellar motor switch protein FliN/FliY
MERLRERHVAGLNDIQVELAVMLGSTSMPIRQILKMSRGAMIPLDARQDDPSIVLVNDQAVARGQILVDGDVMSLEITDVIRTGR